MGPNLSLTKTVTKTGHCIPSLFEHRVTISLQAALGTKELRDSNKQRKKGKGKGKGDDDEVPHFAFGWNFDSGVQIN